MMTRVHPTPCVLEVACHLRPVRHALDDLVGATSVVDGRWETGDTHVELHGRRSPNSPLLLAIDGPTAITKEEIPVQLRAAVGKARWLIRITTPVGNERMTGIAGMLATLLAQEYLGAVYDHSQKVVVWPLEEAPLSSAAKVTALPEGQTNLSPLARLDDFEWGQYDAPSGRGSLIPDLLRAYLNGSDNVRDRVLGELWQTVIHQGAIFEATVHTVPFIAALAHSSRIPPWYRDSLIVLLSDIAAGRPHAEDRDRPSVGVVLRPGEPEQEVYVTGEPLSASETEAREQDRAWVQATRIALAKEYPSFLDLLSNGSSVARASLLHMAAQLGPLALPSLDSIRMTSTDHEQVDSLRELAASLVEGKPAKRALVQHLLASDPELRKALARLRKAGRSESEVEQSMAEIVWWRFKETQAGLNK